MAKRASASRSVGKRAASAPRLKLGKVRAAAPARRTVPRAEWAGAEADPGVETIREYDIKLVGDSQTSMAAIPVPFDPKAVFGKVRVPVRVTVTGSKQTPYTFRSTICKMDGACWIPLRKSHREPAGVAAGDTVRIRLELDDQPRVVDAPTDLQKALKAAKVLDAWKAMSFTHQREHVEAITEARKPETRARRIEKCVDMVRAWAAKRAAR